MKLKLIIIFNKKKKKDNLPNDQPRNYLIDGTFAVTPYSKEFKQLLIIHIAHAEHVSQ